MDQPLRFSMARPVDGGLDWRWDELEHDLDQAFWSAEVPGAAQPRESVFLEHWLAETYNGGALERVAEGKPPLYPEEPHYLLVSLNEDVVAYQRLVRDHVIDGSEQDVPAQLPVAETSPLVAVVIHLIRGWYASDDVLECFEILAAWEGDATGDDVFDVLESVPHPDLPNNAVLRRIRLGERPPIKPPHEVNGEVTALGEALWSTLQKLAQT